MYLGVLPSSPWQHQRIWPASPDFTAHSMEPALYTRLARACDRAGIDVLFLPDKQVANASPPDPSVADSWFDPLTMFAYLAAVTDRIGLVPTLSTTWFEPYPLARQILSLDHLSGGRAGWNAVSSHPGLEDANFGHRPVLTREQMKARHAEAVSLVKDLWTSWDSDAVTHDAATGQWFRPGSVHPVDHHGRFFDVTGPLTLCRSPQDSPVLFMAGASENFLHTAAKDADVVFTALNDVDAARTMARTLASFADQEGRQDASPRLMPGFFVSASGFPEYGTDAQSWVPGMHFHSPAGPEPATGAEVAAEMVRIVEESGIDGFIVMLRQIPEDITFLCDEVVPALVELGARPEPSGNPEAAPSTLRANLGFV
jgi:alkanesulfonate monooxygenase SsuD/methylene tetrahydromethanopterin reductase-like flavin-dependent oxidoreductase (luciferase family)